MDMRIDLEPKRVFDFFQKICAIPHGSGNTESLSLYCMETARAHGLWCQRDAAGNVLIRRPAAPGCESALPVVLQAHLDMVCVRADPSEDVKTAQVRLYQDGDLLMAEGSTLGADNGIGVAYILALLTQEDGNYPMLEGLLTVDEESTMGGANAFDVSWLQGRRMINLDSEEEGYLLAGSAGGVALDCSARPQTGKRTFRRGAAVTLKLSGMEGGHSGLDIHKGRGNAIRALAELLLQVNKEKDCLLCSFSGGHFSNAIPDEASCRLVIEEDDLPGLSGSTARWENDLRRSLRRKEIILSCSVDPCEVLEASGLTKELAGRWLRFAACVPDGIQRMDSHTPDMVSLSTNLGILRLDEEVCQAHFALRSNVERDKELLLTRMTRLAEEFRFVARAHDGYPCWEYRERSPLRDRACQVYTQVTGHSLQVSTIHAGAECGIFGGQLPDLDCISIGPDILDAHTVNERVSISSVGRVWNFLQALLEELGRS